MEQHLVTIRISREDMEYDEYHQPLSNADCRVSLIRLFFRLRNCSLKVAKDAVEAAYTKPQLGDYMFNLNDAELGRLYLFLRENHRAISGRGTVAGYEVINIQSLGAIL